jgi:DNA-binding transcriptional MerR regulator
MGHAASVIPEKIYFKIGEVCELVGVQAHVLRYWETEFPQLSPQKNRSGQRSYRRKDVETCLRIKELLYDEMYTIAGARKKLQAEQRGEAPKLQVVKPTNKMEGKSVPSRPEAPGLFDDPSVQEQDTFDLSADIESETISPEVKDALRTLASQLMELREMLKTDQTRDAENHLQNNRV